jgi:hypothetical protein
LAAVISVIAAINNVGNRTSGLSVQLRTINSSHPKPLQYLQHIQRRFIMGTFKEVVCGSLIVITFAAILHSVPF